VEEREKGNNNQNEHNTLFDYFEIISGGLWNDISHKTLWKRNWNPSTISYTIKYIKFIFEIFRIVNPLTR
jgi:hypothetical protein